QSAITLSGGEAQRVKLSAELSKRGGGETVYILDEPTTGLHFHDVSWLIKVLVKLRDRGNSIIVIEHNLDLISRSDWIIDMGPEGGLGGGSVVEQGTPAQLIERGSGYTAQALKTAQSYRPTGQKKTG
ncbi:MAG: excinuclease ABC subunit UvrA, partial [Betaproteobacteria bacterium]